MKQEMTSKLSVLSAALACVLIGGAREGALAETGAHDMKSHGSMAGMTHGTAAAETAPQGVVIRESKVQDLSFTYRIYSWAERNVMMKGMEGHAMPGMDASGKATNHLMLFIKDGSGKELADGKVGFILTGPDKAEQKTLTMGMTGGYGADVVLKAPGAYTIKTKAKLGDRSLEEEFGYTVK